MAKKKASKAKTRKPATKPKPAAVASTELTPQIGQPPRIELPRFRFLGPQKRVRHSVKLPSVWRLTKTSAQLLWEHKAVLVGVTVVYGLLNLVLVRGLAGAVDVGGLKHGSFGSGFSVFVTLLGSAGGGSSDAAGSYEFFLAIMASLAIIWSLRQLLAGSTIRIRDAYYRGMYPLIPFILVLGVVALELLPAIISSALYGLVISNGIAVLFIEKLLWALLFALGILVTLYLLSSSLLALYIVTLPDMTPLKALRSARQLVRHRRWTVMRKVISLPLILLLVAAVIMVPIIIVITPLAQWIFFILTIFSLTATHTYMYNLYRELLRD